MPESGTRTSSNHDKCPTYTLHMHNNTYQQRILSRARSERWTCKQDEWTQLAQLGTLSFPFRPADMLAKNIRRRLLGCWKNVAVTAMSSAPFHHRFVNSACTVLYSLRTVNKTLLFTWCCFYINDLARMRQRVWPLHNGGQWHILPYSG